MMLCDFGCTLVALSISHQREYVLKTCCVIFLFVELRQQRTLWLQRPKARQAGSIPGPASCFRPCGSTPDMNNPVSCCWSSIIWRWMGFHGGSLFLICR